jgi:hypothetical protein
MWREQLAFFWDGQRRLTFGYFDLLQKNPMPLLTLISSTDERLQRESRLIDVIDLFRWDAQVIVVDLPEGHRFVQLITGLGDVLSLHLCTENELPADAETQLLMVLKAERDDQEKISFKLRTLSRQNDQGRAMRGFIAQASTHLLWAISQKRANDRGADGGAIVRLTPAQRIFPLEQSRVILTPQAVNLHPVSDMREAPFAIMQHWVNEGGAPRAILELLLREGLEDHTQLLRRIYVVIAMRQRQRFDLWIQTQKRIGAPQVDPLTLSDIRAATGVHDEETDAVTSNAALTVANLLRLIIDPETHAGCGVAVRRQLSPAPGRGELLEIDFYGAALGDDVGVILPAAMAGDLLVAPQDPGGSTIIRLFRFDADALTPWRVSEEDPLVAAIIQKARETSQTASAAVELRRRREQFVQALNQLIRHKSSKPLFDLSGDWRVLDPIVNISFAYLFISASQAQQAILTSLGGFEAYDADPALTIAIVNSGEFAEHAQITSLPRLLHMTPLLQRYLAVCGVQGMATENLTLMQQARIFLALQRGLNISHMRVARISLPQDIENWRVANEAAQYLMDKDYLAQAFADLEKKSNNSEIALLSEYLLARESGEWTSPEKAQQIVWLLRREESVSSS